MQRYRNSPIHLKASSLGHEGVVIFVGRPSRWLPRECRSWNCFKVGHIVRDVIPLGPFTNWELHFAPAHTA